MTSTTPGRRERLRAETAAEIKAAALEEVHRVGAADVSLRAVARRAGISPAGLYRYFDGRDELLTALIADSFGRLGQQMSEAASSTDAGCADPVVAELRAVMGAYHRWSVEHPHEFGLVFGNPVPGYAAPIDGPTTAAMESLSTVLFRPMVHLWVDGRLRIPESFDWTEWAPSIDDLAAQISEAAGTQVPPSVAGLLLATWARLHGVTALEVFGQFRWVYPNGADQLVDAEINAIISQLLT